jgi:hypothetical protein
MDADRHSILAGSMILHPFHYYCCWSRLNTSTEKDHYSLLHIPHLNFSKFIHLCHHEPLDFAKRNFLSGDFDPNLSEAEWKGIRENVESHGNKLLLAWPTIPVPVKGSDSRAVDAIRFLSSCGFEVDLIYWRDSASEIHNDAHDDRPERAEDHGK